MKIMKYINYALRLLIILLFVIFLQMRYTRFNAEDDKPEKDYLPYLQEVLEDTGDYEYAPEEDEWSIILDADNNEIGWFVSTTPYLDNIHGYAGPIPILIIVDKESKMQEIVLLPHDETPGFMTAVKNEGLLEKWIGATPEEASQMEVDTISGATMSSDAIIRGVQQRLEMVGYDPAPTLRVSGTDLAGLIFSFVVYLLSLAVFFRLFALHKKRLLFLTLNVIVLGIFTAQMLSLSFFRSLLRTGIPWQTQPFMMLILLSALLITIITGKNHYCSHLCPFGSLQELFSRIFPSARANIPSKALPWLSHLRSLYLIILVILIFSPLTITLENWEPFASFRPKAAAISTLAIAVISLVLSVYFPRIWCRFVCPTGRVLDCFKRPLRKTKKSK